MKFEELRERHLEEIKVVVLGDQYLDLNGVGGYVGQSREKESIPVFGSETLSFNPGGGANLTANYHSVPIEVYPCGLWGTPEDIFRIRLEREFADRNIDTRGMIENGERGTGVFLKFYFPSGVHVERLDFLPSRVYVQTIKLIKERLSKLIQEVQPHIIMVADYDEVRSGFCFPEVLDIARHSGALMFGTSRKRILNLKSFDFLIMNRKELFEQVPTQETIDDKARQVLSITNSKNLIVTKEGTGATLYYFGKERHKPEKGTLKDAMHVPPLQVLNVLSVPLKDVDTCGCGDTFAVYFSVSIAAGCDASESMKFGNAAARIVTRTKYGAGYPDSSKIDDEIADIESKMRRFK